MRNLVLGITLLAILAVSCQKEEIVPQVSQQKAVYIVNGGAETIDIYDVEKDTVYSDVMETGEIPNSMRRFGDYFYLVNSGSATIQKIDFRENQVMATFELPQGSNPWDIAWDGSNFYVTSWMYDRVYKLNSAGEIVDSADAGVSPMGVTFLNGYVYVVASFYDRTNFAPDTGYVYKFSTDLQKLDSLRLFENPTVIAHDGLNLYIAGGSWTSGGVLVKVNPDNLSLEGTLSLSAAAGDMAISDGFGFLVGWSLPPTVVELSSMAVDTVYQIGHSGSGFMGIDVSEDAIYVSESNWVGANYLWKIDRETGDTVSINLGDARGAQVVRYIEITR